MKITTTRAGGYDPELGPQNQDPTVAVDAADAREELLDDIERKANASKRKAFGQRIMVGADDALALIAENRRLERIAKAATAFVDEQGKRVDGQYGLRELDDFALGEWRDLVAAVKAAGR